LIFGTIFIVTEVRATWPKMRMFEHVSPVSRFHSAAAAAGRFTPNSVGLKERHRAIGSGRGNGRFFG
jgi:hypothetical protein